MSIFYYKYECPECGNTIDELPEGVSCFTDSNYIPLQCPACKKVDSINLSPEKEKTKGFPPSKCCHSKMMEWDRTCPQCGKLMVQTVLRDDII